MSPVKLVKPEKVFLLPLLIKFHLMKTVIKTMDQNSRFYYLKQEFLRISEAKIKEGIFIDFIQVC
jgi:hypothetical protein